MSTEGPLPEQRAATLPRPSKTMERAWKPLRREAPGRYDVDEIRAEPLASAHTSKAWNHLIHDHDGRVMHETDLRPH